MTPAAINEAHDLLIYHSRLKELLKDTGASELNVDGPCIVHLATNFTMQYLPDFAGCIDPVREAYVKARNNEIEKCLCRVEERLKKLGVTL